MRNLSDSVALITGASSGIGRAIAIELSKKGTHLSLVGRNKERLTMVAQKCQEFSQMVKQYEIDLGMEEQIYSLKDKVSEDFGYIDILIHSAGTFTMGNIENTPVEELDRQFTINVRAPYLLTQLFLPMIKEHKGQILFINSSVGLKAKANLSAYSASKHALKAVADSLREEINNDGVKVITIFPGRTATLMQEQVLELEGVTDKNSILERLLQPEDVASAVLNVLSLPDTAEVTDLIIRPFKKIV